MNLPVWPFMAKRKLCPFQRVASSHTGIRAYFTAPRIIWMSRETVVTVE